MILHAHGNPNLHSFNLNRSIPAVRDGHNPGAVRVVPLHGEVRASQGGGHEDARVPHGYGGVGDVEAVEHNPGGGHVDGADDRAHGLLHVRHAQGRESRGGVGYEKVLGEVEARLGDDGGDVRRGGRGGGGGQQLEGDEEGDEERGGHGGEEVSHSPRFGRWWLNSGVGVA